MSHQINKPIAIITARGGSKRIPRKNIKLFCGKPIIQYSIETALKSNIFDEVIVSTDDQEIANLSSKLGANVPFLRSKKNSDDFSGTADVLFEVITELKKKNKNYFSGCCIYPTAPFITTNLLLKSYSKFHKNNYDTLFPILKYNYPIQRSLTKKKGGKLQMLWPENYTKRSQSKLRYSYYFM